MVPSRISEQGLLCGTRCKRCNWPDVVKSPRQTFLYSGLMRISRPQPLSALAAPVAGLRPQLERGRAKQGAATEANYYVVGLPFLTTRSPRSENLNSPDLMTDLNVNFETACASLLLGPIRMDPRFVQSLVGCPNAVSIPKSGWQL